MYATTVAAEEDVDGHVRQNLKVRAVSPGGTVREIAELPAINEFTDDGDWVMLTEVDRDAPWSRIVTPDGFLAVRFERQSDDDRSNHEVVRIYDLHAADPLVAPVELPHDQDRYVRPEGMAFGPDGRFSGVIGSFARDDEPPDAVVILDPAHASGLQLPWREPSIDGTGPWLADGSGWGAGPTVTLSALDASLIDSEPPVPGLFLATGARQRSTEGLVIESDDVPSGFRPPCQKHWVQPAGPFRRPIEVLHDGCRDDRLLDIRWDVDGRDVLMLLQRDRRIRLTRVDDRGRTEVLARLSTDDLGARRRRQLVIDVDAIAPGPREGELLLAMRAEHANGGWKGPLVFFSTADRVAVRVHGSFAGFSASPIDEVGGSANPGDCADASAAMDGRLPGASTDPRARGEECPPEGWEMSQPPELR